MPSTPTLQALSRALIALAWEDGHVTQDEIELLKDITFQMPEMTAHDWVDLQIYWITPIGKQERQELFTELINNLQTENARRYVLNLFNEMIHLDGEVTSGEAEAMRGLEKVIDSQDAKTLENAMLRLMESVLEQRYSALAQNQLDKLMRREYDDALRHELGLNNEELRKLSLTGAMMARVAYADLSIDRKEVAAMDRVLQRDWSLDPRHAQVVVDAALSVADLTLDNYRLLREFYENTLPFERLEFMGVLFRVAYAHEGVSDDELNEIRHIARALKISEADYSEAETDARRRTAWAL